MAAAAAARLGKCPAWCSLAYIPLILLHPPDPYCAHSAAMLPSRRAPLRRRSYYWQMLLLTGLYLLLNKSVQILRYREFGIYCVFRSLKQTARSDDVRLVQKHLLIGNYAYKVRNSFSCRRLSHRVIESAANVVHLRLVSMWQQCRRYFISFRCCCNNSAAAFTAKLCRNVAAKYE